MKRRFRGRLSTLVKEELVEMIVNGELRPGDQLLPEEKLAEQLEVSRPTLREALRMLEVEGYIVRKQGKGTFIREWANLKSGLECWRSISEIIQGTGRKVGTKSIRMQEGAFEPEVHRDLNIAETDLCVKLERVRTADDETVSYSVDYIARWVFGYTELKEEMFEGSLVKQLETTFGVHVSYSMTNLVPVVATGWLVDLLEVPEYSPILMLDEIHYDAKDRPVFLGQEYFPYSRVQFHLIRQRVL